MEGRSSWELPWPAIRSLSTLASSLYWDRRSVRSLLLYRQSLLKSSFPHHPRSSLPCPSSPPPYYFALITSDFYSAWWCNPPILLLCSIPSPLSSLSSSLPLPHFIFYFLQHLTWKMIRKLHKLLPRSFFRFIRNDRRSLQPWLQQLNWLPGF